MTKENEKETDPAPKPMPQELADLDEKCQSLLVSEDTPNGGEEEQANVHAGANPMSVVVAAFSEEVRQADELIASKIRQPDLQENRNMPSVPQRLQDLDAKCRPQTHLQKMDPRRISKKWTPEFSQQAS